jgi:hypothetical protein
MSDIQRTDDPMERRLPVPSKNAPVSIFLPAMGDRALSGRSMTDNSGLPRDWRQPPTYRRMRASQSRVTHLTWELRCAPNGEKHEIKAIFACRPDENDLLVYVRWKTNALVTP